MSLIPGDVSYDFLKGTPTEKVTYGRGQTNKLSINIGTFGTPKVPLIDYNAANDLLESKEQHWNDDGGHANLVNRNNAEKAWDKLAKKETYYVGGIANGDEATMIMGGCTITKTESSPTHKPNAVINPKFARIDGSSGCAHFESDHDNEIVVDSFLYIVGTGTFGVVNDQLTMSADAVIVAMKSDTHRKTDISGLPVKKDLNGWIYAINSAGAGQISGPFPIFTL